jgi:hypothetical protein
MTALPAAPSGCHEPGAATAGTWRGRLQQTFGIDIGTCPACGGAVRIITSIEDLVVIENFRRT